MTQGPAASQPPASSRPAGASRPVASPQPVPTPQPGVFPQPVASVQPVAGPTTGSHRVVLDPARRADVLFRVRREEDHEISPWWMIGAFLTVSTAVIVLLSFVPG